MASFDLIPFVRI